MHKKIKLGKKVIWIELKKVDFKEYYIDLGKGFFCFQLRKLMFDFMITNTKLEKEFEEWLDIILKDEDKIEEKEV